MVPASCPFILSSFLTLILIFIVILQAALVPGMGEVLGAGITLPRDRRIAKILLIIFKNGHFFPFDAFIVGVVIQRQIPIMTQCQQLLEAMFLQHLKNQTQLSQFYDIKLAVRFSPRKAVRNLWFANSSPYCISLIPNRLSLLHDMLHNSSHTICELLA